MARSRNGVEIAYESHERTDGDAPTVVLVHGWAGDRTFWSRQIDVLTERYRVVAMDLGGHGESGTGRGDWNLPAFGDDVVAVVEAVGARDVALVGHSMGGDTSGFAARLLGDRVPGLVWVDTFRSLGDEPTSSADYVARFVAPLPRGSRRRGRPVRPQLVFGGCRARAGRSRRPKHGRSAAGSRPWIHRLRP